MIKVPFSLREKPWIILLREAEKRHITMQELIRAVIVGEWIERKK